MHNNSKMLLRICGRAT